MRQYTECSDRLCYELHLISPSIIQKSFQIASRHFWHKVVQHVAQWVRVCLFRITLQQIKGHYYVLSMWRHIYIFDYPFSFFEKKKNIERHTAHTIVSWPNPKQWVTVHTSDLMMIIRQSIYILSIITKEMGKLKTHSPTYYILDNWENMFNLTYTLEKLYLTGIS